MLELGKQSEKGRHPRQGPRTRAQGEGRRRGVSNLELVKNGRAGGSHRRRAYQRRAHLRAYLAPDGGAQREARKDLRLFKRLYTGKEVGEHKRDDGPHQRALGLLGSHTGSTREHARGGNAEFHRGHWKEKKGRSRNLKRMSRETKVANGGK